MNYVETYEQKNFIAWRILSTFEVISIAHISVEGEGSIAVTAGHLNIC